MKYRTVHYKYIKLNINNGRKTKILSKHWFLIVVVICILKGYIYKDNICKGSSCF